MKNIHQDLKSNNLYGSLMKQSMWLRIVLSGDWCLCLALHTPSGACHRKRRCQIIKAEKSKRWWYFCSMSHDINVFRSNSNATAEWLVTSQMWSHCLSKAVILWIYDICYFIQQL